jgi:exodeoxyribonuclease VIII
LETKIECKARPDFLREGHLIVDVKSTDDASYRAFQRSLANFQYHVQAAFYLDGASAVLGQNFNEFVVLAVEKDPPYAVNTFLLDEAMINEGRALYRRALQMLKCCMEAKVFPAYPDQLVNISLPAWAYRGEE